MGPRSSARAAGAGGAALEGAALVLGQTTPHTRVLTGLECVLEADLGDGAASADRLRLLDLIDSRTGVPNGEEQFGVDGEAGGLVAPVHAGAPCDGGDGFARARIRVRYPLWVRDRSPH